MPITSPPPPLHHHREAPALTDISLVLFADIATAGKRRMERINTLMGGMSNTGTRDGPPRPLLALVNAGLVTVRKASGSTGTYIAELTDRGLERHRQLITALRA